MKYLFFVLTVLVNIVAVKVSHFSFSISFANTSASISTRVNASTSANNTTNQKFKFSSSQNLNEVLNKTDGEDPNSSIRRSVSSVSENLNPNRIPQSFTLGILGSKPLSSEQILCISFFGKRNEDELTDLDMRAIKAVLKIEEEIKVAPLTRAEAKSATVGTRDEVRAEYEKSIKDLFLNGINRELFERVRRKILDESKDSTQSEQSGVSERDQVLADQLNYTDRFKDIFAKYMNDYPELIDLGLLDENRKADLLKKSIIDNKMDLLEALLNLGIDPDLYDPYGNTALITAVDHNNIAAVRLLIEFAADVNKKNKFRSITLSQLAIIHKDLEIFNLLLKSNINLEVRFQNGNTLFLVAALENSLIRLEILQKSGVNIHAVNSQGRGALHNALSFKAPDINVNVIEWLIAHGLDINQVDNKNRTPFMYSVGNVSLDIMNLFIKHGSNVNHRDKNGNSGLHYFVSNNFVNNFHKIQVKKSVKVREIIFLLLESGWNPFLKNNQSETVRFTVRKSIEKINIDLLKAELAYIEKNGLDSIQELNDIEKAYYRDLIKELDLTQSPQDKEKIIRRAAREDPRMGVQK